MSYPPDPSSGWNPGRGSLASRGYEAPPASQTRPLPRAPHPDYAAGDYPASGGYEFSGGYPPPRPDRSRRNGVVLWGVLAVLVIAGGGFYAAYSFTESAIGGKSADSANQAPAAIAPAPPPTVGPSEIPTPTPEESIPAETAPPVAAEPFQDPELRDFAGRVAQNGNGCRAEQGVNIGNVTEVVTCAFNNGFTVRYLKFSDSGARDSYSDSVRGGLNGQLDVRRDSFWTAQGQRQGRFVSGSQNDGNTQYVYWNSLTSAVSGEILVTSDNRRDAERFWKRAL